MARTLNAQQFCVAMYWAARAGVAEARPYGFGPGKPSGHYARHLQPLLGGVDNRARLYEVAVPGHHKLDLSRTVHKTPMLPPHESVAEAMTDPKYVSLVREWLVSDNMPPAYEQHPVVLQQRIEDPELFVLPLALYLDAVPYPQTDSVLGVWIECLATSRRWLCTVLRKRNACKCGCRGWCSFHPVFTMLSWSLQASAEGLWPSQRHDGSPWRPSDDWRKDRESERMPRRGAIVFIKGDWSGYASTIALPNWQHSVRPCFECVASGPDMYVAHGNSIRVLR